ncbi:hypothetical protein [Bacteroides acidifaciens]|uniref:Uncharacterized protein n=1 Tax=Bacteroides acidifaciens TaxID=85831 RepID=A0A4S2B152_9BACE|nr:hypothetical protein [Bacteroides acidifaciens]TGY07501.1 hypothetical protein E5356_04180 [Bacteroides acidifaciens]
MRAITITITEKVEETKLSNFIVNINSGDDVVAIKISDNMVFIAVEGDCALGYVEAVAANCFNDYEIENLK